MWTLDVYRIIKVCLKGKKCEACHITCRTSAQPVCEIEQKFAFIPVMKIGFNYIVHYLGERRQP